MGVNYSPADILCQLLIDTGDLSDPEQTIDGWPGFVEGEPDTPDNCVTFYNTADKGGGDGRSMVTGEGFQHNGIQVRVRGKTSVAAYDKATSVKATLEQTAMRWVSLGNSAFVVCAISGASSPLALGRGDRSARGRQVYTMDMFLTYRDVTDG